MFSSAGGGQYYREMFRHDQRKYHLETGSYLSGRGVYYLPNLDCKWSNKYITWIN